MATAYLEELKGTEDREHKTVSIPTGNSVIVTEPEQDIDAMMSPPEPLEGSISRADEILQTRTGDFTQLAEGADVPLRFREKKRLHWAGKTCG